MHVFTDTAPDGEPGRDDREQLIRAAMERAAEDAPTPPDLVPVALVRGRRRRARSRAAIGAGMAAVAALGVLGATLPMWGGGAEPTRNVSVASSASATGAPQPTRTPVHVEPSPGESSMADLPPAERARREEFQQWAAALFDELLPEAFGPVRPVDLDVSRYQGGSDGQVFPLVFSVRPKAAPGAVSADPPCTSIPEKHLRCREATLPNGITVRTVDMAKSGNKEAKTVTDTVLLFERGRSSIRLSAGADDEAMVSAPVTTDQLLAVAQNARFLKIVDYADAHPMEPMEHAVRGG
ncbi:MULTISPECIES: hypothetical protein [unclassified Streptomyces]|uniref:hypothetical protein n=1 Tax=unclassified Streptomyces TaxID=2593676 RepID=UPI002ED58235|nr:hypothetical protein OH827_19680 [Streptomyces sp. NBC_00891]WSY07087.1 hypothetical protein OG464_19680 [Streptomyces sp. NBC_00890]WSZ08714.1 hypothetical protein OG704_19685 [Streptomyces sp. NBC_00869]WSZ23788.1 hypothetical protein OG498_13885 [Streptomyces sp. NBC_00870]